MTGLGRLCNCYRTNAAPNTETKMDWQDAREGLLQLVVALVLWLGATCVFVLLMKFVDVLVGVLW